MGPSPSGTPAATEHCSKSTATMEPSTTWPSVLVRVKPASMTLLVHKGTNFYTLGFLIGLSAFQEVEQKCCLQGSIQSTVIVSALLFKRLQTTLTWTHCTKEAAVLFVLLYEPKGSLLHNKNINATLLFLLPSIFHLPFVVTSPRYTSVLIMLFNRQIYHTCQVDGLSWQRRSAH